MHQNILRTIPSINELLESPEISRLIGLYPRPLVVDAIREVLDNIRKSIRNKRRSKVDSETSPQTADISPQSLCFLIQQEIQEKLSGIEHAINATGIILHTGLGRAPLTEEASGQLQNVTNSYCTLEIEKISGRRAIRYHCIEQLICMLTCAESALVVNNNAAAVLLALDTLAKDKEVIISRSQLVEIGGEFRMPDVMQKSGAILVEVGTTNKTYLTDYSNAITERTGLILKVHQSNFKIVGFTDTVDLKDLVSLGQIHNIPVTYDLGSGALINLQKYGLPYEPTVQEAIKAGVDIVTFSTDKLLGGPQGGILAGKKRWLDLLKKNPLTRALRVGKLTIAGLEATLKLYLEEDIAVKKIPVINMLLTPLNIIEDRCRRIINNINPKIKSMLDISTVDGFSEMGGGALPAERIPTRLISVYSKQLNAEELAMQLRSYTPPIFGRIEYGHMLLDMRTVCDEEVDVISQALENIFNHNANQGKNGNP